MVCVKANECGVMHSVDDDDDEDWFFLREILSCWCGKWREMKTISSSLEELFFCVAGCLTPCCTTTILIIVVIVVG